MVDDFYCEQVLSGDVKIEKVVETDRVLAYKHTRPYWSVHIVVIPKIHIDSLLTIDDPKLLLEIMDVVRRVAADVVNEYGACRVVTNLGLYQESKHLHWHIGAGEPLQ
jgi:histidine triad (HIT) family protein